MRFIVPNYIKNFKCDGALCNSYCCREWKVAIDEETKNKYENLPAETREKIFLNIAEKEGNLYPLKLTNEGVCPFLRKDCLCDLQKKFGEDYLSNICFSYPRVNTKFNDTVFQSLTLSCPVAVKLVLFYDEIFFEEKEIKNFRIGWHNDIENRNNLNKEFMEDIISAGLFILKDNSVSIENRLKIIFEFYIKTDICINDKKEMQILLNSVENNDFQNEFLNKNCDKNEYDIFNKNKFMSIIIKLYNVLYEVNFNEDKIENLTKIYNENFEEFNENFIKNNRQIFTNYLVNEFFMRVYPYAFNASFAINAKVFILSWYALQFALFMMYMDKGLNEERLIFGVRRLVERIDHGKGVIKRIVDIAKEFK